MLGNSEGVKGEGVKGEAILSVSRTDSYDACR